MALVSVADKRGSIMTDPELKIVLPFWADSFLVEYQAHSFVSDKDKMMLAIELSRLNIEYGTGGPFGAALFNRKSGKLISIGVNLVTSTHCSVAHAEMVAIISAQNHLNTYDLSRFDGGSELASSTEPCTMCMGAIIWSGIGRLLCGATDTDARKAGFDEGPKPKNWTQEFENRGIKVTTGLLGEEAAKVLAEYKSGNGIIYNPQR